MIRTIQCRVRLSAGCHRNLDTLLAQQRQLWNQCLAERIATYKGSGKGVGYAEQQKALTLLRQANPAFARFHLHTQRTALRRLEEAFQAFYRRCKAGEKPGFPRFKRQHGWRSVDVPRPCIESRQNGHALRLKGVGCFRFQSLPAGKIKLARIIRSALRVSLQFVMDLPDPTPRLAGAPVGLDLGVKQRAMLTTGESLPPVRLDRREIKRKQRKLSRAQRGSKTRAKKRRAVARAWERARMRERNALHRWTTDLVRRHNRIAIEDLAIRKMLEEGHRSLHRAIAEQNWDRLMQQLTYKAESAGGKVQRVDPAYTSMRCSGCEALQDMPLEVREYECASCGLTMDRDLNAAWNILLDACVQAGWGCEALPRPGASRNVRQDVAAIAGHDAEPYESTVSAAPVRALRH